jgi:hypothetical protein
VAHNGRRPRAILLWRPVILLGGGFAFSVFEAIQPMLGRHVEWAIVSLATTMMGLEFFQRASEPKPPNDQNGPEDGPVVRGRPGNQDGPVAPVRPANQAALAVRVVRAVRASRKAPAAGEVAVGPAVRAAAQRRTFRGSSAG